MRVLVAKRSGRKSISIPIFFVGSTRGAATLTPRSRILLQTCQSITLSTTSLIEHLFAELGHLLLPCKSPFAEVDVDLRLQAKRNSSEAGFCMAPTASWQWKAQLGKHCCSRHRQPLTGGLAVSSSLKSTHNALCRRKQTWCTVRSMASLGPGQELPTEYLGQRNYIYLP